MLRSTLSRFGAALLICVGVVSGCNSGGDGSTGPTTGSILLVLSPTNITVAQGSSATVTGTLTRSGGFTGDVPLTVEGTTAGVTGSISNMSTVGTVTTATITIRVGAAVAPGTYPLTVRGTASGLTDQMAALSLTVTVAPIITGISDIRTFLERCPTNDPAYNSIRQDFELRLDGKVITTAFACTEPYSALPIDQLTDELVTLQVLRTAYYMNPGTEGKLPWTPKGLWAWMKSRVAGVNLKTAPGQLYCCDLINGKLYFSTSRQDATQRDYKRTWPGIDNSLTFYAHELRHADAGSPGHVNGCAAFPLPTDPLACDATYDLGNLGGYGVAYWLESSFATGFLHIGIGCSPAATALEYVSWNANSSNSLRARFVTNVPPTVTPTMPYGGPCNSF